MFSLGRKAIFLTPAAAARFELADWKQATVQFNYHISIEKMLYSVPYEYIKKKVDVRVTEHTIEIFYNHNRIASHRRLTGRPGQYSTITEHMPQGGFLTLVNRILWQKPHNCGFFYVKFIKIQCCNGVVFQREKHGNMKGMKLGMTKIKRPT